MHMYTVIIFEYDFSVFVMENVKVIDSIQHDLSYVLLQQGTEHKYRI